MKRISMPSFLSSKPHNSAHSTKCSSGDFEEEIGPYKTRTEKAPPTNAIISPPSAITLFTQPEDKIEVGAMPVAVPATDHGGTSSASQQAATENDDYPEDPSERKYRSSMLNLCGNGGTGICALICLVLGIGITTSTAFIIMGVRGSKNDQDLRFEKHASEFAKAFQSRWNDYEVASLWTHEACRGTSDQAIQLGERITLCTRQDFSEHYLYLQAGGLDFAFVAFFVMVFGQERDLIERESRSYYDQNYRNITYQGVTGYLSDDDVHGHFEVQPRSDQPIYLVSHYVEPLQGNEWLVDFDIMSIPRPTDDYKIEEEIDYLAFNPVLSERMLFPTQNTTGKGYNVIFLHPGVVLPDHSNHFAYNPGGMGIYVPDVLLSVAERQTEKTLAYVFDNDDPLTDEPAFLAGVLVDHIKHKMDNNEIEENHDHSVEFQEEASLSGLLESNECQSEVIPVVNRQWTVVVCKASGTYHSENQFVIVGGMFIFFACLALAVWMWISLRRMSRFNAFKASAEREKAALLVKNAERVANAEKEINEWIAHEIRNPVAAALAACSFVSSAVHEKAPLCDEESRATVRDDVHTIESSLHFTNDLLRTMIDMHKAVNNRLEVEMSPTAILHDVLQPVATMLHTRDCNVEVQVVCEPENLVIETDKIRLKQLILNLAGNSRKFVQRGYIRMCAKTTVDGQVELSVEDSGPGIPSSKRPLLFQKYQESLDSLSQGTGLGLSLCKSLSKLLNGNLFLDESFDSGLEGYPGTRFVLRLNQAPYTVEEDDGDTAREDSMEEGLIVTKKDTEEELPNLQPESAPASLQSAPPAGECMLPERLSVLVVDDDTVLRRLISRSLNRVAPSWNIVQASNGETALLLVDSQTFDLIFMDQYMASTSKQLLGTEATRALRARGVSSRICGLSANNMEESFLEAGADAFLQKPIPSKKEAMAEELRHILVC